jgi:hypothetical protein
VDGEKFIRIVGRRAAAPPGSPPREEARAAMAAMARYRTRAPKGVFTYQSHEEANRDRERWLIDAVVARHADD